MPLAGVVRTGAADQQAYAVEAAPAQQGNAGPRQIAGWLARETVAADVLRRMNTHCLASRDEVIGLHGSVFPVAIMHTGQERSGRCRPQACSRSCRRRSCTSIG